MTRTSALSAFAIFGFVSSSALTLSAAWVLRNIENTPQIRFYPDQLTWPLKLKAGLDRAEPARAPAVVAKAVPDLTTARASRIKKKIMVRRDSIKKTQSAPVASASVSTVVPEEVSPSVGDDAAVVLGAWRALRGRMIHLTALIEEKPAALHSAAVILPNPGVPAEVSKPTNVTTVNIQPRVARVRLVTKASRAQVPRSGGIERTVPSIEVPREAPEQAVTTHAVDGEWAVTSQAAPVGVLSVGERVSTPVALTEAALATQSSSLGVSAPAKAWSAKNEYSTSFPEPASKGSAGGSTSVLPDREYSQALMDGSRAAPEGNFYEAFSPTTALDNDRVKVSRLAYLGPVSAGEALEEGGLGLFRLEAPGYFPTLGSRSRRGQGLPLLALHSVGELSVLGPAFVREMGIVFGRVAPGFRVEMKGLTPVTFDRAGTTYFLALNVVPGHATVTLRSPKDGTKVSVRVLVQGGVATYADMGEVRERAELKGEVVSDRPVAGALVEVNETAKSAFTDKDGAFVLRGVPYVNGYPIELHTSKPDGKRISESGSEPEAEKDVYWVSAEADFVQLAQARTGSEDRWLSDLEVKKNEAPRLLASFHGLKEKGRLKAVLTSHGEFMGLLPEIYAIGFVGGEGEVLLPNDSSEEGAGVSLDPAAKSIYGFNLQEGFWTLELSNERGQVVWSKLLFFKDRARTVSIE